MTILCCLSTIPCPIKIFNIFIKSFYTGIAQPVTNRILKEAGGSVCLETELTTGLK
jgi:hypothetical protein